MTRLATVTAFLSLLAVASCDHAPSPPTKSAAIEHPEEAYRLRGECAKLGANEQRDRNAASQHDSCLITTNYVTATNRCLFRIEMANEESHYVTLEDGQTGDVLAVNGIHGALGIKPESKIGNRVVSSEEAAAFISEKMKRDDGNEVESVP
jgi:hypothetical protein